MAMRNTPADNTDFEPVEEGNAKRGPITQLEETTPEDQPPTKLEDGNLVYAVDELQPELHARTWIALAAMCLYSFTQLFALLGPPTVLGLIATDLNGTGEEAWIPNTLVLVQAALVNILASASDLFQARKSLLVGCCTIAFVGAAIAPGSQSVGRLICAQTLIGFGNAIQVLAYAVPSEILPTRWRPMAQATILVTGAFAMVSAPLVIGALVRNNVSNWRSFYWIETGLWGSTALSILVGYRPPKRHTRLDHLSFWQKIGQLDLLGALILAIGLVLLLAGLSMGGPQHPWASAETLSTLIIGIVGLIAFGIYEWKGTKTGILHHELFNHNKTNVRTFVICLALAFMESPMLYAMILFYPVLTQALFEQNLLISSAHVIIYYGTVGVGNAFWGWLVVRLRSIREALLAGFFIHLVGAIGMSTIEPGQSAHAIVFSVIMGFGIGAILGQVTTGVQLASPHQHLAIATALALSVRAIATTAFTSIYTALESQKFASKMPSYIAKAAIAAGLPGASIPAFVQALAAGEADQITKIPGVSPSIILAGTRALQQAYADSIRYCFIISVPVALIATVLCWWIGDLKKVMTWHVDAPVEKLKAKLRKEKVSA